MQNQIRCQVLKTRMMEEFEIEEIMIDELSSTDNFMRVQSWREDKLGEVKELLQKGGM